MIIHSVVLYIPLPRLWLCKIMDYAVRERNRLKCQLFCSVEQKISKWVGTFSEVKWSIRCCGFILSDIMEPCHLRVCPALHVQLVAPSTCSRHSLYF